MPSQAAQLVHHIYSETAKGNGQPFLDAMHEDMTWRTIGSGAWSGLVSGRQAILDDIIRPLRRRLEVMKTVPLNIIDGGDEIVALQARGANLTREGTPYENDYCFVIRVADGKLMSIEEYCDTALIDRVLGDRPAAQQKPTA
jgi:ketosteroid isomerase-like protein